jgi:hypothetical protein
LTSRPHSLTANKITPIWRTSSVIISVVFIIRSNICTLPELFQYGACVTAGRWRLLFTNTLWTRRTVGWASSPLTQARCLRSQHGRQRNAPPRPARLSA